MIIITIKIYSLWLLPCCKHNVYFSQWMPLLCNGVAFSTKRQSGLQAKGIPNRKGSPCFHHISQETPIFPLQLGFLATKASFPLYLCTGHSVEASPSESQMSSPFSGKEPSCWLFKSSFLRARKARLLLLPPSPPIPHRFQLMRQLALPQLNLISNTPPNTSLILSVA